MQSVLGPMEGVAGQIPFTPHLISLLPTAHFLSSPPRLRKKKIEKKERGKIQFYGLGGNVHPAIDPFQQISQFF